MYYPNPVPENAEDIRRFLNDELQRIRDAIGVELWIEIGSTNAPAFENSWVNYNSATNATAAVYKDPFERVWLKGAIKTGSTPSVAFTLPVNYRPSLIISYSSIDGTGTPSANIEIHADGTVNILAGNNAFISLDGISWKI